ncbi:pilus assembly protein PilY [Pseudomonas cavernicola]|uniref:Pilus assembly protein PilY n=1 Tax=Pseudomonas cavernicola TaxID=2320866 RepID=A0A418XHR3_9PSED|nr:pilus assembly protein PilY [Pseudomonas cavernicola]
MKKSVYYSLFAALAFSSQSTVQAEDIDLFVGNPPGEGVAPNVLIVVDNTANWSQAFTAEMNALASVVAGLPEDKFRVGLMMFTETGKGNQGNDGGYVRAAIRPMSATNKPLYGSLITNFDVNDDKSNGGKAGKTMEEAYLYFSHGAPHAGNQKVKTDYLGNAAGTTESNAVYALRDNALLAKNGAAYTSPIVDGCAKNFVIYISNSAAQDNENDAKQASEALKVAGGSTTTIPLSPTGSQENMADEWARFMKKSSLGIATYTIEVVKATGGQGPGWSALLNSMARASSGKYFDVSSDPSTENISKALNAVFSEIQSHNSVFASVSLPVSVNTQGTYLNQVYIGMFRPDGQARPRWAGNLKQYKLGYDGGVLKLLDAGGTSAVNNGTGFITECARSFWTPTGTDTYWAFDPLGGCMKVPGADPSNSPDGNVVEKGAQAYKLRDAASVTGRTVLTCGLSSCPTGVLPIFNNDNVSAADVGASNDTEHEAIINYARGLDVLDEDRVPGSAAGDGVTLGEMRPTVHGDIVHSRPVAINYGGDAAGSRQVVVFYGGNDGLLHAVQGNREDQDSTAVGGKLPGQELWSFMPPEFHAKAKRLMTNAPKIDFPGISVAEGEPAPVAKDYGMDGPVTAYKQGSNAWIYATMRRGGRHVYAFDVSTPGSPSLLWRQGCSDTGCTTGFDEIGQTWSAPKVVKAAGSGAGATPMLIMGGGYDPCEDTDNGAANNNCTSANKGNRIYLLDAQTGTLKQSFDTERGVVADVVVVPDSAGLIKYAYAVDLGGNVYRISGGSANVPVGSTPPALVKTAEEGWTITKIASLGCSGGSSSCSANRKFMFAPSVVEDGSTYHLMLGSGDREKPLASHAAAGAVDNHFFMLKDMPTNGSWLTSENTRCGANWLCLASLTPIGSSNPSTTDLTGKKGWYLALQDAEQAVTSAVTVFDTVTFSTHQPTPPEGGQCTTLGTARVYNVKYTDASSQNGTTERYERIAGDGLPPSPVAGMVTLDDGSTVPFLIGGDPNSALEGGEPPSPAVASQPKSRVFWNIEQ